MNFDNTFRDRRVLVTGDTGFKGSWLCEWLLAEGAEVYGLGLPTNTNPSLFNLLELSARIQHTEIDIRDADILREYVADISPDIIFHLAAQPLVRLSYDIPVETYATNVMGTVHLLDAIRRLPSNKTGMRHPVVAIMVTTDKCYENKEWLHGYREEDPLGGHDPYSSSKGACEIAIQAYRKSFFNNPQTTGVAIASARAGNVIGGGDWSLDRIVPDCIRALGNSQAIPIRNKTSTRPWQHVLEPLGGYLLLAAELWRGLKGQASLQTRFPYTELCTALNFGPDLQSNRTVDELVSEILKHWPGESVDKSNPNERHEATLLNLSTDKAHHMLDWSPRWDFETTIKKTIAWYRRTHEQPSIAKELTLEQIQTFTT